MALFGFLLWVLEHWWILAILAFAALACCTFTGIVSVSRIIAELLKALSAFVTFFVEPADQIAGKVLYGLVLFVVGLWLGHMHGVHQTRQEQKVADQAAAVSSQQTDQTIAATADALDKKLSAKMQAADQDNEKARDPYVTDLESQLAKCGTVPDADLRRLRGIK